MSHHKYKFIWGARARPGPRSTGSLIKYFGFDKFNQKFKKNLLIMQPPNFRDNEKRYKKYKKNMNKIICSKTASESLNHPTNQIVH